jgi:hypothetical protein
MEETPFTEPATRPATGDELARIERWATEANFENAWVSPTLLFLVAELRWTRGKLELAKKYFADSEAELRELQAKQQATVVEPPGMSPVPLAKANREKEAATDLG